MAKKPLYKIRTEKIIYHIEELDNYYSSLGIKVQMSYT